MANKLDLYLQIESRGIVLLGDFNPSIFHPFWLASKGLIQEDEANNAKIDVIINELARFQLGEWLKVEVTRNRCEFTTMKSPYFLPLKDLVSNVFKILGETPIKAVGINNIYDLSLKSEQNYYKFGDVLAPLSNWSDVLNEPKLCDLQIVETREEGNDLLRRVIISPTDTALKINFGVHFNVNNHYALLKKSKGMNASLLIEEKFDLCAKESSEIVSNILSKIFK